MASVRGRAPLNGRVGWVAHAAPTPHAAYYVGTYYQLAAHARLLIVLLDDRLFDIDLISCHLVVSRTLCMDHGTMLMFTVKHLH